MAKNTTKAPAHNGKPITAFFARSTKGLSSSQDASPPVKTRSSKKTSSKVDSEKSTPSLVATETSNNASKSSGAVRSSQRVVERKNDSNDSSTSAIPMASTSSLKRVRSPSLQNSALPTTFIITSKLDTGSPERQKHNEENTSGGVSSSSKHNGKKRARISTLEDSLKSELLVPSSQSDEEELLIPSKSPRKPTYHSPSSTPARSDDHSAEAMDVDDAASDHPQSPEKPLTPTSETFDLEEGPSSGRITPPPSDLPSAPCTPRPLDAASKTAKIIADIRRMAYATSSPETVPFDFDEGLVVSSDEDDDVPSLLLPKTLPLTSKVDTEAGNGRPTRYALRNRSGSPTSGSRNHNSSDKKTIKAIFPSTTVRKSQVKKPVVDPIAALLKEKSQAPKVSDGSAAFARAELCAQKLVNGDSLFDDMDDFDGDSDNDAAKALAENPDSFANELSNLNMDYAKDKGTMTTDDEDERTVFKPLSILKEDKAMKHHDESSEKRSGIFFWSSLLKTSSTSAKAVNTYELSGSNTTIRLFNACIRRHDLARAATLLNTDFLYTLKPCDRSSTASQLYDLVFYYPSAPEFLRDATFTALEQFWASSEEPATSSILFSQILKTILSLGADTSVISANNWITDDLPNYKSITPSTRGPVLSQLLALIITCARFKRLQVEEIPDIVLVLVMMGMDTYTSSKLLHNVSLAIDRVCNYIAPDGANVSEVEIRLCSNLLQCAQKYDPINKARMVSLLSFGSGMNRRIANFLAFCIITDKQSIEQELYSDTPPLPPILEQLEPYSRSSSSTPGKFALHPKTDYTDLGFYITILGVAVSNLRNYVAQEGQESAARHSAPSKGGSPKKSIGKVKTNLQTLKASLDRLHSDIVDTRATHLDRTRTKATIKVLAYMIHYQREYWKKSDAKTLHEYFSKK